MVDPPSYRTDPDPEFADRLERRLLERLTAPGWPGAAPPHEASGQDAQVGAVEADLLTLERTAPHPASDGTRAGPPPTRRWFLAAAVATVIALLGAVAVTSRSDEEQVPAGPGPGPTPEEVTAFCAAIDDMGLAVSIGEGNEGLDEALLHAEEIAPAEIRAAVTTMADTNRAQVDARPRPEETPPNPPSDAYFIAAAAVGDYLADHCGWQVIDVTATDHAFVGLPAEPVRGKTLIRLTNRGTEYHELILQRIHAVETRSIDELLALPDGGGDLLDYRGGAFAPPGQRSWAVVDLDVNRYAAMCFIPIGATTTGALRAGQADPDAPRHHTEGMTGELRVP